MIPNTIWKTQPKEKSCPDSEQLNFGTQSYPKKKKTFGTQNRMAIRCDN